jgi:hypothetical protein
MLRHVLVGRVEVRLIKTGRGDASLRSQPVLDIF